MTAEFEEESPGPVNPLRDPQDRRLPRIAGPSSLVIFGVTGDLARKKLMPAIYDLANRGLLPPGFALVGFARRDFTNQDFAQIVHDSVKEHARTPFREEVWQQLAEGFRFVPGDLTDDEAFKRLRETVDELDVNRGTGGNHAFYLSIPPGLFPKVVEKLKQHGLADETPGSWRRVVIEKPFGHDLKSARELNHVVESVFPPEAVFRIDHYLGKESVEGIRTLRFDNQLFEPLWSREHIAAVEVTLSESFGTDGRAGFYDGVGAVRDVLQNHVLQIVAYLAMERPAEDGLDALRTAQVELLRQARPMSLGRTVLGQYAGYRDERGVPAGSTTETFVATELEIDSDRWRGVPFRLRTGKQLPVDAVEVVVEFRRQQPQSAPNLIRFRLGKADGLTISIQAKEPGRRSTSRPVDLAVDFDGALGHRQDAYERLIDDVLDGDQQRFASTEVIEQEWRIVAPILDAAVKPAPYGPGTWGPEVGGELVTRWHDIGATAGERELVEVSEAV